MRDSETEKIVRVRNYEIAQPDWEGGRQVESREKEIPKWSEDGNDGMTDGLCTIEESLANNQSMHLVFLVGLRIRGKEINREALNSIMDRLYNREMEMVTNDNKSATSTTFSTITSNG
uniref:Uncharacterized protein n=1 Tax=Pristionchus pacificus TaxID=54126 RepID=A0A2A6B405_PRIPA|eukprot:PDM60609.1 hypothetical protein PRIPAC_53587 [Pristionchus pacificus]